jgi:hypothetical protein
MMGYVIYEKWFDRRDLRDTLKNSPTIFGTIIWSFLSASGGPSLTQIPISFIISFSGPAVV